MNLSRQITICDIDSGVAATIRGDVVYFVRAQSSSSLNSTIW
jgi:hypothetical protein